MSLVASQLMSAEDLWQLPENGKNFELINGEVVETLPPGALHGTIAVTLATLLHLWSTEYGRGCVGVRSGFVLKRNPDSVRGPDVYYVRAERIPSSGVPEAFWEIAPDLAVEVVSPSEGAEDVRGKVRDFLATGTSMVWVVYPRTREVIVHLPDGTAQTFEEHATLTAPAILPNFSCAVSELFA